MKEDDSNAEKAVYKFLFVEYRKESINLELLWYLKEHFFECYKAGRFSKLAANLLSAHTRPEVDLSTQLYIPYQGTMPIVIFSQPSQIEVQLNGLRKTGIKKKWKLTWKWKREYLWLREQTISGI
jgi:hypothetical protein